MRVLMVADDTDRSGGHVAARLLDRGAVIESIDRDGLAADGLAADGPRSADLEAPDLLLLLGSHRSAHDPRQAVVVEAESRLLRTALTNRVAVMAICYGAQLAARALGGTSYRADDPEVGWRRVDTIDPVLCPEGPWAQLHRDVFVPPQQATVLGSSWAGPQCFIDDSLGGRLIAWQFHPEATAATFERWVGESSETVRAAGADPRLLVTQGHELEPAIRNRAHRLVDDALEHLGMDA